MTKTMNERGGQTVKNTFLRYTFYFQLVKKCLLVDAPLAVPIPDSFKNTYHWTQGKGEKKEITMKYGLTTEKMDNSSSISTDVHRHLVFMSVRGNCLLMSRRQ